MIDLVSTMAQGTMKAAILHARDKGINNDQIYDLASSLTDKLREVMKSEWVEFNQTLKDALDAHMGEPMYKEIMNTYCNSWAVKALKPLTYCNALQNVKG